MATSETTGGVDHLTVVPANFEPAADPDEDREEDERVDREDGARERSA